MERIHGIDVSFCHHASDGNSNAPASVSPSRPPRPPRPPHHTPLHTPLHTPSPSIRPASSSDSSSSPSPPPSSATANCASPDVPRIAAPRPPARPHQPHPPDPNGRSFAAPNTVIALPFISPPPPSPPLHALSRPAPAKGTRRGAMLRSRASTEKLSQSPETPSRRPGWISSLSQKFSSSSQTINTLNNQPPAAANSTNATATTPPATPGQAPATPASQPKTPLETVEDTTPYVPQQPKSGNFFSNTLRRFSASTPAPSAKVVGTGGVCPRRTLNVDRDRERCELKELQPSRLKRVAFSVDVEVAGYSQHVDVEPDIVPKADKKKDIKIKEMSEGAALKNPQKVAEEKDKLGKVGEEQLPGVEQGGIAPNVPLSDERKAQLSAEQMARDERAERRRMAGAVPMETSMDEPHTNIDGQSSDSPSSPRATIERPPTDPVRMYRRCCQLREAPVLKRITEQLMNPQRCGLEREGIVGCLDLRGSRMQLQDIVCVGDWLSIVPVRKVLLDNANLTDEGLRHLLSGLLSVKPPDLITRRRGRSNPYQPRCVPIHRTPGIVEKITLKNNPRITAEGWKFLFVFLNMSKSLKAIDVSMIPFVAASPQSPSPRETGDYFNKAADLNPAQEQAQTDSCNLAEAFYTALKTRRGDQLKELTMSNCRLSTQQLGKIVDAALACGIETLGIAQNRITAEGVQHVIRFIQSKSCKGLDVGGNDLRSSMSVIAEAIAQTHDSNLWGLSVADCRLDAYALAKLLPPLVRLPNVRFLDLSHNHDLFAQDATALGTLRKYLPQMRYLRRLHLADISMSPAHAIGIAEVLPEIRNINHISFLDNALIKGLDSSDDGTAQEEAAALYTSLMVAVRCSKTLLAIDIETPEPTTNEVILALHKQLTAYTLRNLERYTATDAVNVHDPAAIIPDLKPEEEHITLPQILVHLVDQPAKGAVDPEHDDEVGPDQDYVVGGTGVVKALSYCLGQRASDLKRGSVSGTTTPVTPMTPTGGQRDPWRERAQAKEMSKSLLDSARKIRKRIQGALERDMAGGDDFHLRRLQFLDHTLSVIIDRFEQEYPECRPSGAHSATTRPQSAPYPLAATAEPIEPDPSPSLSRGSSTTSAGTRLSTSHTTEAESPDAQMRDEYFPDARLSRRGSNASVASKAMGMEEGQFLRFGQRVRRELLPPRGQTDHLHGTSAGDAPEEEHIASLRSQLEQLAGDELRTRVVKQGLDATIRDWTGLANEYKRKSISEHNSPTPSAPPVKEEQV